MLAHAHKIKRFQVLDPSLGQWLEPFTLISASGYINKYYDTAIQSFFTKGILISTNGQLLEIESNPACVQQDMYTSTQALQNPQHHYQFDLPLDTQQKPLFEECCRVMGVRAPQPFTFKTFLRDNALRETVTIDATRRTYIHGTLMLTVDEVLQHGTFIRFKENDNGRSFDAFEKEVDALVAPLSVKSMSTSYLTQIFQSSAQTSQVKVNIL